MFDTCEKREVKYHPEQPKKYPELVTADMAFATLYIAYEHGPSSRTTVALWATGSHEARRSQAKLVRVALSVQGRIIEPSAKVTKLRLWCRGQPLREAQLAIRGIMTHAFAFQKCFSVRAPCYAVWNRQLRSASALRPWLTEARGGSAYEGSNFTGVDVCNLSVPATSKVRELSLSPLTTQCGVLFPLIDFKLHDLSIRLHLRTVQKIACRSK